MAIVVDLKGHQALLPLGSYDYAGGLGVVEYIGYGFLEDPVNDICNFPKADLASDSLIFPSLLIPTIKFIVHNIKHIFS